LKTVAEVMAEIQAKCGKNSIMRASDAVFLNVTREPTGIHALDFALGGGYPYGRFIHVFGPHGAGKTFIAMKAVAAMQRKHPAALAVWVDIEQVFDNKRARKVGVDLDRLIVIREPNIEASLRNAEEFIVVPQVRLFVFDSVAGIVSAAELEADVEDQTMGLGPRMLNKFMKRWIAKNAPRNNEAPHSFAILINQVREKIRRGGNPNMVPKPAPTGGHGLRFFASIEIEVSKGDVVDVGTKEDDSDRTVIGYETKCLIVKNNTYPPMAVGRFMLCVRPFEAGGYKLRPHEVDNPADLLRYAAHNDIVSRGGAWYNYGGIKWNGKLQAQAAIAADPELQQELYGKIMEVLNAKVGAAESAVEAKPSTGAKSLREKLGAKKAGKRKPVAQPGRRKGK
jgi:recombination protein RecA